MPNWLIPFLVVSVVVVSALACIAAAVIAVSSQRKFMWFVGAGQTMAEHELQVRRLEVEEKRLEVQRREAEVAMVKARTDARAYSDTVPLGTDRGEPM